ncbi:uncharacterized protein LOC120117817 [Hibiscus syriacus]|uniref:uncharacterized protein LOC120117817 n=1 Tax=Hibiscus syriacus TaxID=106335 RepID=UPI00192226BD|nr:uncharacterized protein LOC120117817 [Hibiscus syriacus]
MDWRKLFEISKGLDLDFYPPTLRDGSPVVQPPPEVFEDGIAEWKHSLVGQFLGPPPNFISMQRIVEAMWKNASNGSPVRISKAGNNLFLFSFSSNAARDWVLEHGPWHIYNKPLILRNWEPNLKKLSFDLTKIPVWVHLFNVPLELYSRAGLSYMLVPLESHSPWTLLLQKKQVLVEIPWLPPSCRSCKMFGHTEKGCKVHKQTAQQPTQVWKRKETIPNANDSEPLIGGTEMLQGNLTSLSNNSKELISTEVSTDSSNNIIPTDQIISAVKDVILPDLTVPSVEVTEPTLLSRERGKTSSTTVLAGSKNRFEILSVIEDSSPVLNESKPKKREASKGVANLLNELKTKKKDRFDKAKNTVVGVNVAATSSLSQ